MNAKETTMDEDTRESLNEAIQALRSCDVMKEMTSECMCRYDDLINGGPYSSEICRDCPYSFSGFIFGSDNDNDECCNRYVSLDIGLD